MDGEAVSGELRRMLAGSEGEDRCYSTRYDYEALAVGRELHIPAVLETVNAKFRDELACLDITDLYRSSPSF